MKSYMCKVLAAKRKEQRITYEDLSSESGMSKNQLVWVFKQDGKNVSLDKILHLADVMGVKFKVSVEEYVKPEYATF